MDEMDALDRADELLKKGLEFWNDEDSDNLREWREEVKKFLKERGIAYD